TASDILALMDEVRSRVLEVTGVTLEPEVRILGEDA
ncbi:MAG: UDP-N-acetylenolpyruvoylglucosamine reductase, partial [Kiritimatiellae bacterium]|nr:UDP-N-acetylenolpyruvoylglucosamine reductase [Kiritimatiellia bacterium]